MVSRTTKFTVCATSTGRLMPISVIASTTIEPSRSHPQTTLRRTGLNKACLENEADHDRDDQRVNRDGLGECDTKNHVRLDNRLSLRVATERFHRLAHQVTDRQTRGETAQANRQRRADVLHRGAFDYIA